jgi:polyphenol oxidase
VEHGFGTRAEVTWPQRMKIATVRQVHSADVLTANAGGVIGQGDALITDQPGVLLSVRTADCLPILMSDVRHRAVSAVHAGWRGTVQEIGPKAVQVMADRFGTRPEDLRVAIGPGIGQCCFEVGPEVAVQFGLGGRTRIDLAESNRRQLVHAGIPASQISLSGLCTCCDRARFHSFRRDREAAGRMVSVIGIRP